MASLETNIIILVILLFLSGFFSSAETALISLSRLDVRKMVKRGKRGAKTVAKLKQNPHKLLITILIGNNLVNIAAASFATVVAIGIFHENAIGVATGVMTFLILVFGEIAPKSLALTHADKLSRIIAKPLLLLSYILTPVIWLLSKINDALLFLFGGRGAFEKKLTEEEIRSVVIMGAEEGAIQPEERELIHNILRFNDIEVKHVMTPRTEIISVPAGMTLKEFGKIFEKSHFSRIPVYRGDDEKIVGIFYVKDALVNLTERKTDTKIGKLMRTAYFVPPTKKIDQLFRELQKRHTLIAMVVGEYGELLGLVTMEDLLEEIVGEIVDEMEEEESVREIDDNTVIVDGKTKLERINEILGVKLKSDEFDTVSGYILAELDRIPRKNEKIRTSSLEFTIVKKKGPRIEEVKIKKL